MAKDEAEFSHKEYLTIDLDPQRAAKAAHLLYVRDSSPGIMRAKKGSGFAYTLNGALVTDDKHLERIRKLVIPPAWDKVWICTSPNGHIQVTGIDVRGRKQYRYHTQWNAVRSMTKFHRLIEFGKALPLLRKKIRHDLSSTLLNEEKVLATVVALMEETAIRVGNAEYEKMNGSYGLTTLKDKHVGISGSVIAFSFKGKKGVYHNITLKNKKLARIVKACRDIPGKELFQYYDDAGERKSIDSGGVNDYIKRGTEQEFTAKDFRLWSGSLNMLDALQELGTFSTASESKQKVVGALDKVSAKLGNTRTVCKKYYVHPGIINLYEENTLDRYLKLLASAKGSGDGISLTEKEEVLMKILKSLN